MERFFLFGFFLSKNTIADTGENMLLKAVENTYRQIMHFWEKRESDFLQFVCLMCYAA